MAVSPFTTLPLSTGVYGSRISAFMNAEKNYILTGFKPGYALQAAELNELQEQFYVQQRLTTSCMFNWRNLNTNHVPFWNGSTPYSPLNITTIGSTSLTVTANAGWYNLLDNASGFSYWVYNKTSKSITVTHNDAGATATVYGFTYQVDTINSDSDDTLLDGSNSSNANMTIPGADRIKITITGIAKNVQGQTIAALFGAKQTSQTQFKLYWPYGNYSTEFAAGSN